MVFHFLYIYKYMYDNEVLPWLLVTGTQMFHSAFANVNGFLHCPMSQQEGKLMDAALFPQYLVSI